MHDSQVDFSGSGLPQQAVIRIVLLNIVYVQSITISYNICDAAKKPSELYAKT